MLRKPTLTKPSLDKPGAGKPTSSRPSTGGSSTNAKPNSKPAPKPNIISTGAGRNSSGNRDIIKPTSPSDSVRPGAGNKPGDQRTKPSRDPIGRDRDQAGLNKPRNPTLTNNLDTNKPGTSKPVVDRPGQNKPGVDKPNRDIIKPTLDKPNRGANGSAKPGQRGNEPQVIDAFKPGQLKPNDRAGSGGSGRTGDPQLVEGLRNRDVRDGKAPARERVTVDRGFNGGNRTVINDNRTIIRSNNCGHGLCGGRSNCAYAYDYCRPANWCGNSWGYGGWGWGSGFSFSFGYVSDNFSIGVGYNNNWFNDCNYYQPVYSSYLPYSYCAPAYYYRPYYCRPYYSLRYSYGCYYPRFAYSSYVPLAYRTNSFWWLYDNDDYGYDYSAYGSGYDSGFTSGYEAGQSTESSSAYEPTWLAGGSVFSGSDAAATSAPEPQAADITDGWDLLTNGDPREARRAFERERANNPGDGLPQIGYAISAGLLERYDEAIASMRSALRDDPDAFAEMPLNQQIAEHLQTLLTHYRNITREKPEDVDARFMQAAIRHLLGQDALASYSIDVAIKAGDADESARVLEALIARSLNQEEPQTGEPEAAPAAPPAPPVPPAATSPQPATTGPRQF